MPNTGELRDRIEFQRPTISRGAAGTKGASAWPSLGLRFSKVHFGQGSERRQAGVESGSQAATFICRADPLTKSIVVTDRIVFAGANWDISGIAPQADRMFIEFTAVASRG